MDSNVVRLRQNCDRKLEKNWAERGEKSWQKFLKKSSEINVWSASTWPIQRLVELLRKKATYPIRS